jgi:hypothetical protein
VERGPLCLAGCYADGVTLELTCTFSHHLAIEFLTLLLTEWAALTVTITLGSKRFGSNRHSTELVNVRRCQRRSFSAKDVKLDVTELIPP